MQSYFYYVIIPNMVFIPKLTHNRRDVVTWCCRDADQITYWFLQGHNINNNSPSHYNIMNISLSVSWLQIFLQGQKMVYVGIHLVLLNFYVFLPGH